MGMSSNCIACVMGSKESPEAERKGLVKESQGCKSKISHGVRQERSNHTKRQVQPEPIAKPQPLAAQTESQQSPLTPKSCVEAQFQYSPEALLHPIPFSRSKARRTLGVQHIRPQPDASQRSTRSFSVPRRRSTEHCNTSTELHSRPSKRAVGTLQREMNALFAQKMEELRHKSPMFLAGKIYCRIEGMTRARLFHSAETSSHSSISCTKL
ncbi:hypothetical protein D5F01_LYC08147 [Larimichthys crocea]|uniref:Uncharacterized protein n=1 Tax=Larimichthys crocea TaxID=215358 RepID=A0A6G0IP69_LARCR|nr:hypothetical protein D5F01_LYC08147 [Larimichthys crocea]